MSDERSEEVQDIIDRMPTHWCAWTALIISIAMGIMVTLSFVISYPDTVDGEVSITGTVAPVRIQANASGRLHLIEPADREVREGMVLAYVDNGATYEDVRLLKRSLENNMTNIPEKLKLGELGSSYNAYVVALLHWQRLTQSERYVAMRKSIEAEIEANKDVAEQLQTSIYIKSRVRNNLHKEYQRDSLLAIKNIVTQSELETSHNNYLSQTDAEATTRSSQLMKQSEIRTSQIEIARSHIEEEELIEDAYVDMQAKRNILQTELRLWEEKYIIQSPV